MFAEAAFAAVGFADQEQFNGCSFSFNTTTADATFSGSDESGSYYAFHASTDDVVFYGSASGNTDPLHGFTQDQLDFLLAYINTNSSKLKFDALSGTVLYLM